MLICNLSMLPFVVVETADASKFRVEVSQSNTSPEISLSAEKERNVLNFV